jgi:hypothetical protein
MSEKNIAVLFSLARDIPRVRLIPMTTTAKSVKAAIIGGNWGEGYVEYAQRSTDGQWFKREQNTVIIPYNQTTPTMTAWRECVRGPEAGTGEQTEQTARLPIVTPRSKKLFVLTGEIVHETARAYLLKINRTGAWVYKSSLEDLKIENGHLSASVSAWFYDKVKSQAA